MILLSGIPSETPMRMVLSELEQIGAAYVFFNQRHFSSMDIDFNIVGDRVSGKLRIGNKMHRLEEFSSVYTRLMDDRALPELQGEPKTSAMRSKCRALHDTLMHWQEIAPCIVVNRMAAMGSNSSKPYQAQLIRTQGFNVPETLITNDPNLVLAFRERHQRVAYKSISGVRSIVQLLRDEDISRLEHIRWCPVQFQQFVEGTNLRVHVIHEKIYATIIQTAATDYRYASQQEATPPHFEAIDLAADLADRCICLTKSLGLLLAGIDLKIAPEGEVYCLEVNPSPAFSYFQLRSGQPISRAIAEYLTQQ